ncbi:MAG: hypothetical protein ACREL3_07940 [Gemmatimonadales bacterium]
MCPRRTLRRCALALLISFSAHSQGAAQTSASAGWQATPASVLKNALRAVTAAQLRFFQTQKTYASSAEALALPPERDVQVQILAAGPSGWQARAVHRQQPGKSCVIFVGTVGGVESPRTDADREMAGEEGVPLCDWMR